MAKLHALEKNTPTLVKSYLQANNKLAEYGGGSAKLVKSNALLVTVCNSICKCKYVYVNIVIST